MTAHPRLAFFGSSLVSSYWNGAATYYRGLLGALAARGVDITFYEPDAFDRQAHRDMPDPDWARVVVYPATDAGVAGALVAASASDVVVKASGVGVYDADLEGTIAAGLRPRQTRVFWDVDAPATLARLEADAADPFGALVPAFDLVMTYGGGPAVTAGYLALGARRVVPVWNAVDPTTHFPVPACDEFASDCTFLGNRLPDRDARVREFFLRAAERQPSRRFLLGGAGWDDVPLPANVRYVGHVGTRDHNALNCSAATVLNVNRASMARSGFSPATRVFEAAGAGACLVTDRWEGIACFLEPGREILVADDGAQVANWIGRLDRRTRQAIGAAARRRVLADHTYARRAAVVAGALGFDRGA
jgi:spore maturation protein CgeB